MTTVNVTPKTRVNDGLNDTFIFKTTVRMEKGEVGILQKELKKVELGIMDDAIKEYIRLFNASGMSLLIPNQIKYKKLKNESYKVDLEWSSINIHRILSKSATMIEYYFYLIRRAENKIENRERDIRGADNKALEKSTKFFTKTDREHRISAIDKEVFEKSAQFFSNL